jgi:dihydroorotase
VSTQDTMILRRPDDFHVHFRQGEMLRNVVRETAGIFGRALVMPNTQPPISDGISAARYRHEIMRATEGLNFTPLMTIKLFDDGRTTYKTIRDAATHGVIAAKLYPAGVTTNSHDGVKDIQKLDEVFSEMEEQCMVLCIHGENPSSFCLDKEKDYIPYIRHIHDTNPSLRIVMEHISTQAAVNFIRGMNSSRLAATVTAHHLVLTLDDVIGAKLYPHNFCLPVAKTIHDKVALLEAVTSGDKRFFLGSDTAPHLKEHKECSECCGGCYTAPILMPLLATVFEEMGALDKLEDFTSKFGADFYKFQPNHGTITLRRSEWTVPSVINGVVPFRAGKQLGWKVDLEETSKLSIVKATSEGAKV